MNLTVQLPGNKPSHVHPSCEDSRISVAHLASCDHTEKTSTKSSLFSESHPESHRYLASMPALRHMTAESGYDPLASEVLRYPEDSSRDISLSSAYAAHQRPRR